MPEPRELPLFRWGEELRRRRGARRRHRMGLFVACGSGFAAASLLATLLRPPGPALVWNGSESAPVGLYAVVPEAKIDVGDTVIAWIPGRARRLAAERGYLPGNVPLVKRIAAAAGDRVCGVGEALFVNGVHAAKRLERDAAGRILPHWTGCVELETGEYLLLMNRAPASFDGRYFGITRAEEVIGEARLIWPA